MSVPLSDCRHGESECIPAHHSTCKHCGKEIIAMRSMGTPQWMHLPPPGSGGSAYVPCGSPHAEPPDVVVVPPSCQYHVFHIDDAECTCPRRPDLTEDRRPHSRACGIRPHPHGRLCSRDCPTCAPAPDNTIARDVFREYDGSRES